MSEEKPYTVIEDYMICDYCGAQAIVGEIIHHFKVCKAPYCKHQLVLHEAHELFDADVIARCLLVPDHEGVHEGNIEDMNGIIYDITWKKEEPNV